MMILVTGGSGSGKSEYAESAVVSLGPRRRIYIAAMKPWDEECENRILRHRRLRAGKGFSTVECYGNLEEVKLPERPDPDGRDPDGGDPDGAVTDGELPAAVLVECMSNVVSNVMFGTSDGTEAFTDEFCKNAADSVLKGILHLKNQARDLIIVTNEVFSDGGLYSASTQAYRRTLAEINRKLGEMADRVVEVAVGIPMMIKNVP